MSLADSQAALREGNALLASGRVPEAVAAFRRALGAGGPTGPASYNLGIALRRAGDWRGAVLAFRAAARADAADFDAMQNAVSTLAQAVRAGIPVFEPAPERKARASASPVSIVVCSIDEARLERMRASFDAALGARPHEWVVIRDASSLAEAYMRALAAARHEIVVFCHDDVEIVSPGAFEVLEEALNRFDLVGLAGSRRVTGPAVMWAGHPYLYGTVAYPAREGEGWVATVYSLEGGLLDGIQALDGFFFAARRDAARRVGFDAETFDGFHFYDLDFTWRAHLAGLRLAVTTGIAAIHASEGRFGPDWQRYAQRFRAKFPQLSEPPGPHHSYGAHVASREELLRFHAALRGLAEAL